MNVGQVSRQGSDEEEALTMSTDVDKKSHNLNPPIYKACKFGQVNKDIPQISDVNTVTKNTSL